ncbi:MAG: hypothetical protein CL917_11295 [Deltaproteobacteria bacterium]|nr:hypothetical protein [Deltaproteobacteria bacterium]
MGSQDEESKDAASVRVDELKQRIEVLNQAGDAELGAFGRLDWWAIVLLGFVFPLIGLYLGAP